MRKQYEYMLMIVFNLYEEMIYLKKMLKMMEYVMKEFYQLYWEMSGNDWEFGSCMLCFVGEIYEVKKDNQWIFVGLLKLILNERFWDYMDVVVLIGFVI